MSLCEKKRVSKNYRTQQNAEHRDKKYRNWCKQWIHRWVVDVMRNKEDIPHIGIYMVYTVYYATFINDIIYSIYILPPATFN